MKTLLIQMTTDAKLIMKNIFLWITAGFLVLIIIVVNFFLPKETVAESIIIAHYGMEFSEGPEAGGVEELTEMVRKDGNMIGVYAKDDEVVVVVNNLSEKQARGAVSRIFERENGIPVNYSYTSQVIPPAPFHKRMVPMMISLEAVMTGILLAGIMMLTEKERRITSAYRVSPAGAVSYVMAKTILFSLIGMLYSFLIALFTVGMDIHVGPFLLLSFMVSALFTLMGMAVSVFLKSLGNWLLLMAFLIGTNTIVLFAYIFPAGSMDFMKVLPAYPMIFAFERTMFGPAGYAGNGFGVLALWTVGMFVLCLLCVRFRLLRPHRGEYV